jgi:hypothetical protein
MTTQHDAIQILLPFFISTLCISVNRTFIVATTNEYKIVEIDEDEEYLEIGCFKHKDLDLILMYSYIKCYRLKEFCRTPIETLVI